MNNWNEERKLNAVSLSTIESLQQEMIETDVLIDQYIKDTNSQNELTDQYLDGNLQLPADSIVVTTIFKLANYIPLRLELPVTLKELGSDRSIIGNNELIERLRVIDAQNQRMKQTLLYLDEIWTDRVVPYYLKINLCLWHPIIFEMKCLTDKSHGRYLTMQNSKTWPL